MKLTPAQDAVLIRVMRDPRGRELYYDTNAALNVIARYAALHDRKFTRWRCPRAGRRYENDQTLRDIARTK